MTILPKTKKPTKDRERERPCVPSAPSSSTGFPDRHRTVAGPTRKAKKPLGCSSPTHMHPPIKKSNHRSRSQSPAVNSDDERCGGGSKNEQLEAEFAQRLLDSRGWEIKEMQGDGACLFRAVADQVYGDQEMHGEVRRLCLDYMERNKDHFAPFITEDFDEYLARKRLATTHGNHVEMQAISEIYARPVEVYEYNDQPMSTFHPTTAETNAPLRLSYHNSVHYNAVVDPKVATIGVGLGLPGLVPGAADAQLLAEAVGESNAQAVQLEETMLHDKLHMTDWQRTEEDLKEQVARESYMDYLKQCEGSKKNSPPRNKMRSPMNSPRSFKGDPSEHAGLANSGSGFVSGFPADRPCSSKQAGLYEELLAMEAVSFPGADIADNDDTVMARAILLSQQQFIEDIRRKEEGEGGSGSKHK